MPIRFRCAYCNQLLGIARRKSGTIVRCPTCAGHIVVPNVPTDETEGADESSLVFERSDFDELLNLQSPQPSSAEKKDRQMGSTEAPVALSSVAEPPPGAWGTHAEPPYDVQRLHPPAAAVASAEPIAQPVSAVRPARRTGLLVALSAVALFLTFSAGVLVGHFLWR